MCSPISLIKSTLSFCTSSSSSLSSSPSKSLSLFVSRSFTCGLSNLTTCNWILETQRALNAANIKPKRQTKKIIRFAASSVIIFLEKF